jgi:hypothetical protein
MLLLLLLLEMFLFYSCHFSPISSFFWGFWISSVTKFAAEKEKHGEQ